MSSLVLNNTTLFPTPYIPTIYSSVSHNFCPSSNKPLIKYISYKNLTS
jgi:hypothetical protein